MAQSLIDASSIFNARRLSAKPFIPDAYSAPTTEPALVPHTRSTSLLRASSAWTTPICAKPRAAPPPSASPTCSGRGLTTGGVGESVGGGVFDAVLSDGLTGSGCLLPPGSAQALNTAEAAASEK